MLLLYHGRKGNNSMSNKLSQTDNSYEEKSNDKGEKQLGQCGFFCERDFPSR